MKENEEFVEEAIDVLKQYEEAARKKDLYAAEVALEFLSSDLVYVEILAQFAIEKGILTEPVKYYPCEEEE